MAGRTAKVTAETWVETARRGLIEEGIAGVKVDRLASRLGVTRGGFYHNFRDREELLARLIACWEETCQFVPPEKSPGTTPAEALDWLDEMVRRLIEEDGYDHHFDMAVREWARSDQRAAWAVERMDRNRMAALRRFFEALGYEDEEAQIRARVFYYHQIGYYAIGVRQSTAERRRKAKLYLDIICGADRLAAAREASRRRPAAARG
ncbi:MAG TPA: helix-turn-helix domain-containing protein [Allosphingosinicella sp.]|jgi:AcrR family transcriptional regulator|nr:helix-turn-helix domain-containing protein [Allosphingosinicella sp.]